MKVHEITPGILQRLAWVPLRAFLIVFCSLEVRGIENVKSLRGNMIIASNHTSELDPLLIVACLPFFSRHLPLFFASREKEFYVNLGKRRFLYGGTFFRMMGAYQAYVGLRNYEQALRHHLGFARGGKNVCIFPVGKRTIRGQIPEAKGGVSFLARETKLPIMPIHIRGVEKLTLRDCLMGKRKITVVFGKPLSATDIFVNSEFVALNNERNDYAKAANTLMEKIARLA